MDDAFCVSALESALRRHGRPEIFNTDQGSPFTGKAHTEVLKGANVKISMNGQGSGNGQHQGRAALTPGEV